MNATDTITIGELATISIQRPELTVADLHAVLLALNGPQGAFIEKSTPEPTKTADAIDQPAPASARAPRKYEVSNVKVSVEPSFALNKPPARPLIRNDVWTHDEEEALKQAIRDGMTARQISESVLQNRTHKAIQQRAVILRKKDPSLPVADSVAAGYVPPNAFTDEDDATIRKLVSEGFTFSHIARQIGRTKKSVSERALRISVKQKPHWPEEDIATVKEMIYAGWTTSAIAKAIGRTNSAVKGIVHRNGWKVQAAAKRTNGKPLSTPKVEEKPVAAVAHTPEQISLPPRPNENPVAKEADPVVETPAAVAKAPDPVAPSPEPAKQPVPDELPDPEPAVPELPRPSGLLAIPVEAPHDISVNRALRDYLIFYESRVADRKSAPLYGVMSPENDFNLAVHLSNGLKIETIAESSGLPKQDLIDRYKALIPASLKDQNGYIKIDGIKVLRMGLRLYAYGQRA